MPLIYGDENVVTPRFQVSRLTWVALVSDVILVLYWAFFAWTSLAKNLPDALDTQDAGYTLFFSLAVAFFASVATTVIAIMGLALARKTQPGRRNVWGIAAIVLSLLVNPVIVIGLLRGLLDS